MGQWQALIRMFIMFRHGALLQARSTENYDDFEKANNPEI